jgi:hypothetical protein
VNEQSVNDNAINQNISQIVPEHVLYECAIHVLEQFD